MYREPVVVETEPSREGEKTRQFRAEVVAYIAADPVWGMGANSAERAVRPALFAFVAPAQQARAFAANLRLGRPAAVDRDVRYGEPKRFELMRSAGYRFDVHTVGDGVLTVAYVPELFAIQPSAVERQIAFVCCPPRWWVRREAAALRPQWGDEAEDVAAAAYFVAYLDRRSPLPIVNDLRFHRALVAEAKKDGWAFGPAPDDAGGGHFQMVGTRAIGLDRGLCCVVTEDIFARTLSKLTLAYLEEENEDGPHRIRRPRRRLPDAAGAPAQHRLALEGRA